MKTVDGWIVAAGVAALALAAVVIVRSREFSRNATRESIPSAQAPAPPDAAFPGCRNAPSGMPRWRCQVASAQRRHRLRCYGQRLYYVSHTATGRTTYAPWPSLLQCSNGPDTAP